MKHLGLCYSEEDNDDVIESFWLYIFCVFPSFPYYYLMLHWSSNFTRTTIYFS